MSIVPLVSGIMWPIGRMRWLTWSSYDEPENSGFFPLTLALSPVENVYSWKITDSTGFYVLPEFRTRTANKREWTRMQYPKFASIRVYSRLKNTAHRIR